MVLHFGIYHHATRFSRRSHRRGYIPEAPDAFWKHGESALVIAIDRSPAHQRRDIISLGLEIGRVSAFLARDQHTGTYRWKERKRDREKEKKREWKKSRYRGKSLSDSRSQLARVNSPNDVCSGLFIAVKDTSKCCPSISPQLRQPQR